MLTRYRIEIKYSLITLVLLQALIMLDQTQALSGFDAIIGDLFALMSDLGFVGIFILAVIGNASLLMHIPYTVPLFSMALSGANLSRMLLMGAASGLGGAFGEVLSYSITLKFLGKNPALENSGLLQWVKRTVNAYPRTAPILVFVYAVSPLPDDTLTLPLAMVGYGLKKMLLPLITGKIIHNLIIAGASYFLTSWSAERVSMAVQVDLALGILILFVMVILYQVEKTRSMRPLVIAECAH